MLVSHEAPLSIIREVRNKNDFQYALVHLFETHQEYYNFFEESLKAGHEVLLDNSIFELKEAFDGDKFASYINKLKPTYYIVPDVLEDSASTISSFKSFTEKYTNLSGIKIGAVQGKTYQDIVSCYKFMAAHADYIAISFDFSWYQTIGISTSKDPHLAKLERWMTGRQKLIKSLIDDGIWCHSKPHHLLGNSLPQEMKAYTNIKSIRSVDTSNPVVGGICGYRYIKDYGMRCKPSVLLADLIDTKLDDEQFANVMFNIDEYKKLCK
jgi:hypothetical protein